ncbi:MAG: DUF1178 family protein [Betaproteobacteria bacterium]|jgi:hypothetical protein
MALKVFNLRCDREHSFEGWFASTDDFERQQRDGLLRCPVCESAAIVKALSAPYLNTGAPAPAEPKQPAVMPTAEQMQTMFLRMAREIAAKTEDVGERFPEEARRIHYKEAPERGIRGVASREEAEALNEEGIGVLPLPFGSLLKEPLQ